MLELLVALVLASLRVRVRWARINGRLRMKDVVIAWSRRPRKHRQ